LRLSPEKPTQPDRSGLHAARRQQDELLQKFLGKNTVPAQFHHVPEGDQVIKKGTYILDSLDFLGYILPIN
jgi:hypothetical protein